ncbi:triphosphoribosyl-dephospho-CoA synthase MdcB [Novosphingobium sp. Rr 2-17]|uniref:triphosphoribosyl-dephospho-CoA synthase MdcB n=1 Tax=Novosphingobium sp. Rr 2-17 TaxID=555793 RepID=UPI0002E7DEB1|nr:triphosphoribosyl-dephospho-CoA synthase MdcB [Novosphingobium sp. Rr 2-17]
MRHDCAERIGRLASKCLIEEVETWPKPGLVSHRDTGSHRDMDANMLRRSASVLEPWFGALAQAGMDGAEMGRLRVLGIDAEAAMRVETGGVNTHKGAIFGMGLLAAAAGLRERYGLPGTLGDIIAARWGNAIHGGPVELHSHGSLVARRYRAGGARQEAASGMPSLYHIALPALRRARAISPGNEEAARVEACMALIAQVEDSNLLYRGGLEGLAFAQDEARRFLRDGGIAQADWSIRAEVMHRAFVARNLSPGGCADLLAMALFVERIQG